MLTTHQAGVWVDPPKYYDPAGGVLSFQLDLPHEMLHPPGGMSVGGHITLINHQLAQIRAALALSTALGRKLVLPEVTCGYDKAWYALSSGATSRGVFGGAPGFVVPIRKCPLDHFLEPASLKPGNTIREFSFLDNPRAAALKASTASTALVASSGAAAELKRLVANYGETKVLHITNKPIGALDVDWLDDETQRKFRMKFQGASGSWCCAPGDEARKGAARSSYFRLLPRPARAGLGLFRRGVRKSATA